MNRKITPIILIIALLIGLGCIGPFAEDEAPENDVNGEEDIDRTPAETVEDFLTAVNEGNAEKAREIGTKSFIPEQEEEEFKEELEEIEGTIESIEIEKENITNSEAIVEYRITRNDGSEINEAYELIQENEEWKIDSIHDPEETEKILLTEARKSATNCLETLTTNTMEPGTYSTEHENTCNNTCQGEWLDEEAGTVIEEGKNTLNNSGYHPTYDSANINSDYWVRGACMAGKPEWIINEGDKQPKPPGESEQKIISVEHCDTDNDQLRIRNTGGVDINISADIYTNGTQQATVDIDLGTGSVEYFNVSTEIQPGTKYTLLADGIPTVTFTCE